MLGAILTIAVLVLCWKAGEADDRAEQEQKERYKNE